MSKCCAPRQRGGVGLRRHCGYGHLPHCRPRGRCRSTGDIIAIQLVVMGLCSVPQGCAAIADMGTSLVAGPVTRLQRSTSLYAITRYLLLTHTDPRPFRRAAPPLRTRAPPSLPALWMRLQRSTRPSVPPAPCRRSAGSWCATTCPRSSSNCTTCRWTRWGHVY